MQFKCISAYQRILEQVKPFRDSNKDKQRREKWWLFGRNNNQMRESNSNLERYIATSEVSKHRVFVFTSNEVLVDGSVFAFSFNDAYFLGILSSLIHVTWTLESGGRMATGNTPRYNNSVCFDPFPFPDPTPEQKQKIRELGERLDAHRKQVQAAHPDITITGMYNLLEKLRAGEPFTDTNRDYNNRALVSTLKQIRDDLNIAVLQAYDWDDLIPLLSPSPALGEGDRRGPRVWGHRPTSTTSSSNASLPSTPNAPKKNAMDSSAGCGQSIKPQSKPSPSKPP